jgi:hypothetical protein
MSQYPSPYSPPPYTQQPVYYPVPPDPLAPAKRASVIMFVLGPLTALMGGCVAVLATAIDSVPMQPEQRQVIQQVEVKTGVPAHTLFMILGLIVFVPGILMFVLGIFVRRGRLGPIVASIVLTAIILAWFALNLIPAALHPTPEMALGICMGVFGFVAFGGQLALLTAAAKAAPHVRAAQQQLQAQYWQYQQNMQAYQNGGYAAPMTPPPAPPPPPSDASAPPRSEEQNRDPS